VIVGERFVLGDGFGRAFESALERAFGENLVFAFVFGSFAKGFGRQGHDIDTFVCVERIVEEEALRYSASMRELHDVHGCVVDERYPFELVDEARLERMTREAPTLVLDLDDNDADTFDLVTWVQVLSDAKTCRIGSLAKLQRYEEIFAGIPERWKAHALSHCEDRERLRTQPPLFFIKNVYRFREREELP